MERKNVWAHIPCRDHKKIELFAQGYKDFISKNKTERECVRSVISMAEREGYVELSKVISRCEKLQAGSKVWTHIHGKSIILVHIGTAPVSQGFNIVGAHIDSPRLDVKQNPLYEKDGLLLLDTQYYGGIKKYQWVTIPLALHGVVCKKDGSVVSVEIGEDPHDPVFCITDILIHLATDQMKKQADHAIEGEDLDVLVASKPASKEFKENNKEQMADKNTVQKQILNLLESQYGISEEDFLSAELEVVPSGSARDLGFDRSMILGYGHDDRACAYPSLMALLQQKKVVRTNVCVLVDKEETGSAGATGMQSHFFENTMAEIMERAGCGGMLELRRALSASRMISSDVAAGFDPLYPDRFDQKNSAQMGCGLVYCKYSGARGKSGCNDASAEYMAQLRCIMDSADVIYQTAELGKVDSGGGSTIAHYPAQQCMNVIDAGVPVLSMHAPWEVIDKADLYMAYKGYQAFLSAL